MNSLASFLLLLFCLSPSVSWGQVEASVPQDDNVKMGPSVLPEIPVLWDELWGLKELVLSLKAVEVDQLQALRSMESRFRDGEVEAEWQRRRLDGLEETVKDTQVRMDTEGKLLMELNSDLRRRVEELEDQSKAEVLTLQFRLNTSERSMDDLKEKNAALAAELPFLQTRLRASESMVEQLRRKSAVLAVRLCHAESVMEELMKQTSALSASNSSSLSEHRLDELSTGTPDQLSEISSRLNFSQLHLDELKRDSADQTGRLTSAERRLDELETENSGNLLSHVSSVALEVRLRSTETHLEQLENHTADLEFRLRVSEKQLEDVQTGNTALEVRLRSTETHLEQLENHTADLEFRLRVSEKQLEDVQTGNTGEPKVAFSAGLTDSGSVGPFDEETTLIFSKSITNIGRAYDQTSGVFTAPVRGLYFFSFTAADFLKGYMGVYLYRNNQPIVFNLDLNDHGGYASTSNSVALQLEEGDGVRLSLPASYRLYDDSRNFTVFSGFLLFPL
ncbi:hypothetical protein D5F01_LYC12135 [Larimichthys crocea]|uniref:C1q domain-containing protein n=1 Tax=Larimichthys crocea TaxID=215358 RepID=A0A6G0IFX0_LARCR|nr:hypothetical protein D5F01_LYC12135 [Larimichthys crocea]